MKNMDDVAVFWDYENCPASASISGYTIVNSIRSLAQTFGSVKLFKAYLGVTEQVPVSRALVLRSELQSSGVSLTDCPHNGRKDVADKMIIVDMLAYAIDNPTPSTIVLISGDRDFSYALAMLRLRRYRVVLITLSNAHPSLKAQASLCFDWISDILESVNPSWSHHPASPRHRKTPSTPAHDKFYLEPKDHKTHNPSRFFCQGSCDENGNIDCMNYFQDAKRRKEIFRTPQKHDAIHDSFPPDLEQSKRQPNVYSMPSSASRNGLKAPKRATCSPVIPPYRTYLNGNMKTPLTSAAYRSNSLQITLTPNTSVRSTSGLATYGHPMPSIFSGPSALRGSASLAQNEIAREAEPVSAIQIPTAEPESRASSPSYQPGIYSLTNPKPQSLSSVDQMTNGDGHPDSSASPLTLANISPSPNVTTPLSASPPSFMLAPSLNYSLESIIAPSPLTRTRANPLLPAPYPTVPDKFKILIQCLQSYRSSGDRRPLRSKIGLEINQNGTTYRQAGVLKFSEYVGMAEKAGIVELGGSGGTSWVALRAPWYDVPIS